MSYSPFNRFTREAWSRLRAETPLTLSEADLVQLRGQNEYVALDEVEEIYLPLTRLLNLYVAARQELYRATTAFLGQPTARVPYLIGLGGSVAVGKSTTARILQALLSRWPPGHAPPIHQGPDTFFLLEIQPGKPPDPGAGIDRGEMPPRLCNRLKIL